MAKIMGVGGIFLEFQGEKHALQKWYQETLGLDMTDYGTGFLDGRQLMLVSFKRDSNSALINFRVDDIAAVVDMLKQSGAATREIEDYEYGKFVQFVDPFGNLIELWEPNEETYINMVRAEIESYSSKS